MNIFNESPHFTALLKLQFKLRPKRMHKNAPSTTLKALQMAVQKMRKIRHLGLSAAKKWSSDDCFSMLTLNSFLKLQSYSFYF